MVRGKPIKLRITLTTSGGVPAGADLINDIQLDLFSTADRTVVKSISIASGGVTKESDGVFLLEVASADTLKLPKTGTAYLQGWAEPIHEPVTINLGQMKTNIKNG